MQLNWARTSHNWLWHKILAKPWYTPLILLVIYTALFPYLIPIGILDRIRVYRIPELLTFTEVIFIGFCLILVCILLEKFVKAYTSISTKSAIAFVSITAIPFLFMYPLDALDYYANLWYSERLGVYQENPYSEIYSPTRQYPQTDLAPTPESPYLPYGPVWLLLHTAIYIPIRTLPIVTITLIFKGISYLLTLLSMLVVIKISKALAPQRSSAIVAIFMSPLILYSFVGAIHNDILFILFFALSVYSMVRQRYAQTLFWLTMSIFTKYISMIIVPIILYWIWQNVDKKRFVAIILPWVLIIGATGIYLVIKADILNGIANQALLLGFSISSAILALSGNEQIALYVAYIGMGGWLVITVMYTLTFISRTDKFEPIQSYLHAIVILILVFLLYFLQLFNHWYFMWLLPLFVVLSNNAISGIIRLTYLNFFISLFVWYLLIQAANLTLTVKEYNLMAGILQLIAAFFTFYWPHRIIILPALKKVL